MVDQLDSIILSIGREKHIQKIFGNLLRKLLICDKYLKVTTPKTSANQLLPPCLLTKAHFYLKGCSIWCKNGFYAA